MRYVSEFFGLMRRNPAAAHEVFYYGEDYHQQYLAKPGAPLREAKTKIASQPGKFMSCKVSS